MVVAVRLRKEGRKATRRAKRFVRRESASVMKKALKSVGTFYWLWPAFSTALNLTFFVLWHRWYSLAGAIFCAACGVYVIRLRRQRHGDRRGAENHQSGAATGTRECPCTDCTEARASAAIARIEASLISGASPGSRITASGGLIAPIGFFSAGRGAITYSAPLQSVSKSTYQTLMGISGDDEDESAADPEPEQTYVAPVWGFRSWKWSNESLYPKLCSLNGGGYDSWPEWKPGKNEARCSKSEDFRNMAGSIVHSYSHDAPSQQCSCGFYAVRAIDSIPASGVIGGVVGWGKVIDSTDGWRSEFASIAALFCPDYLPEETRAKVSFCAESYGVPIAKSLSELAEKTKELAKWMAGEDLLEG